MQMGAQAASSGDEQSTHAAAAPRVRWFGLTGLIGVGCIAFGVQQVSDDLPHLLLTSRGECRFPALAWCRSEAHTHRTQRDARCEVTPPPPVPPLLTMTPSDTLDHVRKHGYARVPEVLPRELVARLHAELLRHLKADSSYYSPKGCLGKLNRCSLRWDLPLLFDAVPSLAEGKSKKRKHSKKTLKKNGSTQCHLSPKAKCLTLRLFPHVTRRLFPRSHSPRLVDLTSSNARVR